MIWMARPTHYGTDLLVVDPALPIWPSQSLDEVNIKSTLQTLGLCFTALCFGLFFNAHTFYHFSNCQRENPAECINKGLEWLIDWASLAKPNVTSYGACPLMRRNIGWIQPGKIYSYLTAWIPLGSQIQSLWDSNYGRRGLQLGGEPSWGWCLVWMNLWAVEWNDSPWQDLLSLSTWLCSYFLGVLKVTIFRHPESSVRACLNEMIEWTPNEICWSLSIYYNERDNTVAVYTCGKGTAAIWVRTKTKQNGCWAEYSIGIRYSRLSLFNALKQNVNKFRNLIHYFPFQLIPKLFCSRKTPVKNGTIWNMEWHIKTWW